MRWKDTLTMRLRSLFKRARVEAELDAELRFHVERLFQEYVNASPPPRPVGAFASSSGT